MNKIYKTIRNAALVAAVAAAGTAVANAYTAEDLCGKVVGQVFTQNRWTGTGLPSLSCDGEFTKSGNYLVLNKFSNLKNVKFELINNGTQLRMVKGSYASVDGPNITLRAVEPAYEDNVSDLVGVDLYDFKWTSSKDIVGTITPVENGFGALKVSFGNDAENMLIQLRKYSNWMAGNEGQYSNGSEDYNTTYETIDFYIYEPSTVMKSTTTDGTKETKVQVFKQGTSETGSVPFYIRNWFQYRTSGIGYASSINNSGVGTPSTSSNTSGLYVEYNNLGAVKGTLNYDNNTFTIPAQKVSSTSKINAMTLKPYWYNNLGISYYIGAFTLNNSYVGIRILAKDAGLNSITGKFTSGLRHLNDSRWHPDCGGDLRTVTGLYMTFDPWIIYDMSVYQNSSDLGTITSAYSSVIDNTEDITFNAAITDVSIAHNPETDYTEELDPATGQTVKKDSTESRSEWATLSIQTKWIMSTFTA